MGSIIAIFLWKNVNKLSKAETPYCFLSTLVPLNSLYEMAADRNRLPCYGPARPFLCNRFETVALPSLPRTSSSKHQKLASQSAPFAQGPQMPSGMSMAVRKYAKCTDLMFFPSLSPVSPEL